MSRSKLGFTAGVIACLVSGWSLAQAPATAPQPPNDYSKPETWLCRPGQQDACGADLTTTVVAADGKLTRETFQANADAPIDCFYIYPTVSRDTTGNSDMNAGPEEKSVIQQQFARFASQCRVYAPLYRQFTLTALRARLSGSSVPADPTLGYKDVLDAWNYYLEHDNKGRGVVLIGHSQGSGVLTELIGKEIDGKPVQAKLVSALLLGTSLQVPKGKDVGGAFKNVPLCHSAKQTGCVITYASFRSTSPPPDNSLFGKSRGEGTVAACTNPAALGGGKGALHSYLNAAGRNGENGEPTAWVTPPQKLDTPFVSTPGLLTGECVSNEHGSYLEVTVNADPKDPRTDTIAGDVVTNGQVQANWGLHLIDVNLAMGNLVDIVGSQSKAYAKKKH